MRLFDVEIREEDGALHAALAGEIDLSSIEHLESRLEQPLEGRGGLLVVDLREVTFLDSSGLRLILRLDERQRSAGGRLVIVQGRRRVAKVFELTGAGERLEIVGDPSEVPRE